MDYERIYREFIEDRNSKSKPAGYVERHHIVPRSLGGGDGAANLINLSPEDHFFAHLLLAKIHGGGLWVAVMRMMGKKRFRWQARKSRRKYGWARRARTKAISGRGHWGHDKTEYKLEHQDGRRWVGLRCEMKDIGISSGMADLLVQKKVSYAKGWFLQGRRPEFFSYSRPGHANPATDHRRHEIIHLDGRRFSGTQIEIRRKTGIGKSCCSHLVSGKRTLIKGWHLAGVVPEKKHLAIVNKNARYKVVSDSGCVFCGTRTEIGNQCSISSSGVSRIIGGAVSKGWRLHEDSPRPPY